MNTWTIQFAKEPPQEIGLATSPIADVVRSLNTQGQDTATLIYRNADLLTAAPQTYDTQVRVFRDGVGWFTGTVDKVPRGASGPQSSLQIVLVNVWAKLARIIYQRRLEFIDSAKIGLNSTTLSDYGDPVFKLSSAIFLNEDETGVKIATGAQIRVALNYAIRQGARLQIGDIEAGVQVPREEFRDAVCSELIAASLRWTPDLTTWFDYSVDPPRFHCVKRRGKAPLEFDTQREVFTEISLVPRADLFITGAKINYLRVHDTPNFQFRTLDTDFAGSEKGPQLARTVELYGGKFTQYLTKDTAHPEGVLSTVQLNAPEPLPVGVAARVLESLNDLHYEGSVEIVAQDCPAGSYLGYTLNIANYTPEAAGMNADIRGQTDTLSTGRTTLEVGPPPQLTSADFVELLRAGRPVVPLSVSEQTGGAILPPPESPKLHPRLRAKAVCQPVASLHQINLRSLFRLTPSRGILGPVGRAPG